MNGNQQCISLEDISQASCCDYKLPFLQQSLQCNDKKIKQVCINSSSISNKILKNFNLTSLQHLFNWLLKIKNLDFMCHPLISWHYLLTPNKNDQCSMIKKTQVKATHFNFVINHFIQNQLFGIYSFLNLTFFIIKSTFNPFFNLIHKYAQLTNLQYLPCLSILF